MSALSRIHISHIRIELRRALSIKGNRALPLLAAGRLLHIDLEVDALYRFQLKEEVHHVGKRPDLCRAGFIPKKMCIRDRGTLAGAFSFISGSGTGMTGVFGSSTE